MVRRRCGPCGRDHCCRLTGAGCDSRCVCACCALGARGTLIGRAFLYGLGALGEAGVTRCLEIIHRELDLTMAFCGQTDVQKVDRRILLN